MAHVMSEPRISQKVNATRVRESTETIVLHVISCYFATSFYFLLYDTVLDDTLLCKVKSHVLCHLLSANRQKLFYLTLFYVTESCYFTAFYLYLFSGNRQMCSDEDNC